MNLVATGEANVSRRHGVLDRVARRVLKHRLRGLARGEIELQGADESTRFGEGGDLNVTLRVNDTRFFRAAVLGGGLAVAESYLRGDWDCDDLTTLFRIFIRNGESADGLERGVAQLVGFSHRLFHWWRVNSVSGSRDNIRAHYDLGNEFFGLWLDETLAYSCGIFRAPEATMREASVEKFDLVCRKLDLQTTDRVLEIGSGWGGFAIHAAGNYGCQVTTTTISHEQWEAVRLRIAEAGLERRISLLEKDYRELRGRFDKLVSIEMIEAVGHQHLDAYFRQCGDLLEPDGSLLLQAIIMPERRHPQYLRSVDFIQRFVFPGGCLPSLSSILGSVGRTTDLRLVSAEDFAPHYAETLRRWRRSFTARIDQVKGPGYPDEFIRLWNYYLCYCEAAFEERHISVLQLQFDKPMCRRDAIGEAGRSVGPEVTLRAIGTDHGHAWDRN